MEDDLIAENLPVDTSQKDQVVWLIKVPEAVAQAWEDTADEAPVGTMRIFQGEDGRPKRKIGIALAPEVVSSYEEKHELTLPSNLSLNFSRDVPTMAVLSEETIVDEHGRARKRVALEGTVGTKADCRFARGADYQFMNMQRLEKHLTKKQTQHHTGSHDQFLPQVNKHEKKEVVKASRKSVEELKPELYILFEKHEYYKFEDLRNLTRQPAMHLKAVLKEIADYSTTPPYRNQWHLKAGLQSFKAD